MNRVKKLVLSALFLSLAYVLPFLTGQVPQIGAMLCPMHIPVLLCGFFCGGPWGLAVGLLAPLTRSFILGMPPLFPTALCMSFELAAYGLVSGLLYRRLKPTKANIYLALLSAMVLGRVVWGLVMFLCMGLTNGSFTFAAFLAGAVTGAIPGIILQLVLIPLLVMLLNRRGISE
ncbi:MAG: ECF transporter S component [Oscillospiraceae bacterium]|nr:ECF transporter S component [Oscillospiraceae bacterium]